MATQDGKWTRDQKLSLLSIAVVVFFEVLNHLNVLSSLFGPAYEIVRPFVPFPLGIAVGWLACRSLYTSRHRNMEASHAAEIERIRADCEKRLAEKDAEIARLKSDHAPAEQKTDGPSLDAIMSLSRLAAAGVLDAVRRLEAGEKYVKFGDRVEDSLWLIGNSNGMIKRHVTYFNGYHSKRNEYYVAPEWAAFLAIPENRKALEAMAFCSDWSS